MVFRNVAVERNYKDKEGNWKSTNTFRVQDLPKVELVCRQAYEYLNSAKDTENEEAE